MVVERGGSPASSWEAASCAVDIRLRSFLDPYAGYSEQSARPVTRREVPGPRTVLVIGLGDDLVLTPAGGPAHRTSSFAVGLTTGPILAEHAGMQRCVQLDLNPIGAYRLLGPPASRLSNQVVDLDQLWGSQVHELAERLAAMPDWSARFALLDEALLELAATGPHIDPEIEHAWDRLVYSHGCLAIGELVRDTGWSRRRLAAQFREQIGLTPKELARVLRFARAAELVGRRPDVSLAAIAAHCGYFDQAHLSREFRTLAGCTPSQYRDASLLPALPGSAA